MTPDLPHTVEIVFPHDVTKAAMIRCIRERREISSVMVPTELEWCEQNVTGGWSVERAQTNLSPALARVQTTLFNSEGVPMPRDYGRWLFSFENERDATLFKLFHGGAR